MIYIKTRMRKMPECCMKCKGYYMNWANGHSCRGCTATGHYEQLPPRLRVSKERWHKCPLLVVEDV
jgi:hypothetical protein